MITYSFSSPLDDEGQWQTQVGDEGEYIAIVTASDGTLSTTKNIKIVVNSLNKKPYIANLDEISDITVFEGETISINPKVMDDDGDNVKVTYSGFMTTNTYATSFDDEGIYYVDIMLDDGTTTVTEKVKVTIKNKNRAPVLTGIDDMIVTEGDLVQVQKSATDPDGDSITFSYSAPLSSSGTWQTKLGDSGIYDATIVASDGDLQDSVTFKISVQSSNNAPVIQIADVTVNEGQTIVLNPTVTDADGDETTITYSGWMDSNIYETDYSDSGVYTVTISASDSKTVVTKEISVTVIDQNRPPQDFEIEVIVVPGGN